MRQNRMTCRECSNWKCTDWKCSNWKCTDWKCSYWNVRFGWHLWATVNKPTVLVWAATGKQGRKKSQKKTIHPFNHSDLKDFQVDSLNTARCSVIRSGELVTWFNVHQVTINHSYTFWCICVSEGTIDTYARGGGLKEVVNGWWRTFNIV